MILRRASLIAVIATLLSSCAGTRAVMDPTIAQLEAEVQRVQDVSEIKRLQRAYGYYVDRAAWDDVANLFTDDASLELALDGVYIGKERIRKFLYTLTDGRAGLKEGQLNEHMQLQPIVHVAPDGLSAKGRWRAFIMVGQYGKRAAWGEGVYENEYVKQHGVWKISKTHWYQTFVVPYEGGWSTNKDLNGGVAVSKTLPPDKPPTETYPTWPGVYVPPYHYPNPVTGAGASIDIQWPQNAAADPEVRALQQRVQRLADTDQIERLISAYGYYLDKQQWTDFTNLFAEDASMEISQRGIYVGKASIRRALELFGPENIEPDHLHNHIQLQPVIHLAPDGKRAWVRNRALSQIGTFGRPGIWGDGIYENEFVKENGVWKYKKDHIYTTFFTPYDRGWLSGAGRTPGVSEKIPPDRPPSEVYQGFPEVYIPPFHYQNPVTGAPAMVYSAPQQKRLQALAAKLQRLEDERAIENLQRSYGFYVDKALWKDAADLFAENGTLEIGGRGVFVGKKRILDYLARLAPDGLTRGRLFNHMQLQPIVTVSADGASAKARWRFLAEMGEAEKYATWGCGTYENAYVKDNGVWKIKSLHAFFRMYTPYLQGWAKEAIPNTRPESDLPPDRPPTVKYDIYPATFIPPMHYVHPVTGH
jgi:SnoaL-like domain